MRQPVVRRIAVSTSGGDGLGFNAAVRTLWRYPETAARIIPAQANALFAFVIFAIGAGISLVIPR